jgi:hypothetical protein
VGFCHVNKSEQVTCSEQEQDAKHPSKIHDRSNTKSSTNNLRQCQTFINNVSIDSWQCRMEIDDVKSQLIKWQCRINIVNLKSEQVGKCASTQLVGSCHDEKSEQAGCDESMPTFDKPKWHISTDPISTSNLALVCTYVRQMR